MVIRGELKPGEQIVQEALANKLGISRTPLRRALAALVKENFLEMSPRGEAYVRTFGFEEINSIFEIRAVLEGLSCRLAAPMIATKHIAYLRSLITTAANDITPEDWSAYREADIEFHTYLATLADDKILLQILDSFQIVSLSLVQGLLRPPEETLPEHVAILDALETHDADLAEQHMVTHIRRTLGHIKQKAGEHFPTEEK